LDTRITEVNDNSNSNIRSLDTRITEVNDNSISNINQIKALLAQELEDTRWDLAKLQSVVITPIAALNDRITIEISSVMDIVTNTISNDIVDIGYRVTNIETILQGRLDTLEENIQTAVQKPIQQLDARVSNIERGVGNRLEVIEKRQLLLSDETSISRKAAADRIESLEKGLKSQISQVDQGLEIKISEVDQKVREEILQASQKLEQIIEQQKLQTKVRKALVAMLGIVNNPQAIENRENVKSSLSSGLEAISSIPQDLIKKLSKK
jgi:uncharacterized protein YqgV (UPF0045/DUF77 family)